MNTSEKVEVYLAKQKGALEEGDKLAVAGLWERALETFETAKPSPKPTEDAYRLYNTGVAYEALAYKAEDPKAAMKYLDQAAIDYGKAIDARPGEKYFLEPQRRIEDAIAHYRQLEDEKTARLPNQPPCSAYGCRQRQACRAGIWRPSPRRRKGAHQCASHRDGQIRHGRRHGGAGHTVCQGGQLRPDHGRSAGA